MIVPGLTGDLVGHATGSEPGPVRAATTTGRRHGSRGDRARQHSIRINRQRRVCFRWSDAGREGVEVADYHYGGKHDLASHHG